MTTHVYNYNAAGSDSNTLTNILFTPSFQRNKIIFLSMISTHVLVIKCVILFSENPQTFRISLYCTWSKKSHEQYFTITFRLVFLPHISTSTNSSSGWYTLTQKHTRTANF